MTELTEEIQRDPGRFLKHLNTDRITTLEEFEQEMKNSLPGETDWNHPSGKTISGANWKSSKQRLIDKADVLFETDETQERIASNVESSLERAGTLEEVRAIPVNLSEYSSSTKERLSVIKRVEASNRAREGRVQDRARFFLENKPTPDDFRYYRKASAVADRFGVSEEQAINKIRESGLDVDEEGRIG